MKKFVGLFLIVSSILPCFAVTVPSGLHLKEGSLEFQDEYDDQMRIQSSASFTYLEWEDFLIQRDHKISFHLPDENSTIVIVSKGKKGIKILGDLECNGRCVLLSPRGIKVEATGFVSCGEFIASTFSCDDSDLSKEDLNLEFKGNSKANITNLGKIYSNNKDLFLFSRKILSKGELHALKGSIYLGANSVITYANEKISFPETKKGRIALAGSIEGKNVKILSAGKNLTRAAISLNKAKIQTAVINSPSNEILLHALKGNVRIKNSSLISSQVGLRDNQSQDSITILGKNIRIKNGSQIELFGQKGCMKSIMIGRDLYDGNSPCAEKVFIGSDCRVSSTSNSFFSGGHICIFSKNITRVDGFLESSRRAFFHPGGNILVHSEGQTFFQGKLAASTDDKHLATCSKVYIGSKELEPIIYESYQPEKIIILKDPEDLEALVDAILEE